jgi:hypothetical protein
MQWAVLLTQVEDGFSPTGPRLPADDAVVVVLGIVAKPPDGVSASRIVDSHPAGVTARLPVKVVPSKSRWVNGFGMKAL